MLRLSGSVLRQPYGKFPSVSVNDNGVVVEVHQPFIASTTVYYQVGRLNKDEVDLSEPKLLDTGRYPKIAINNDNRVVEVHEGRFLRRIFYRIGKVPPLQAGNAHERPGRIDWPDSPHFLCWGRFPAVAVHNNRVLVTYDYAHARYTTHCCMGTIDENGMRITWHECKGTKLFTVDAVETSVAMNAERAVAAGRGWTNIVCAVGILQPPQVHQPRQSPIQWTNEISFGHLGFYPSICLDEDNFVLMVWQSFTLRQLKYTTGKLQGNHLVMKADNKGYDYGYNPTIALSPTQGKVVEEHETNLAIFRCTLYYHTGLLDKIDPANEEPAGENRPHVQQD